MRTTVRGLATTAVTTAATAALLLGGLPTAQADEVFKPVDGTLTLVGRGYGHGRGMSQYGSYAAASAGKNWQQIVAFYYPGASLQNMSSRTIRVSTQGRTGATARVGAEAGLKATDGTVTIELPTLDGTEPITSWEVARPSTGGTTKTTTLWFRTAQGRKALRSTEAGRWTISAADGSVQAQNSSGRVVATYLGRLSGHRSGSSIVPVLTTSLDNYTRQVVPFENIASWPAQAHAAQAVAARSYAAWHISHPRSSLYDICDTTSCQVMGGIEGETSQTKQGIALSAGQVLAVGGKPVRSEFSSSNGGQPAPAGVSYTTTRPDPFEPRLTPSANTWQTTVKASRIQARWPQVGTFTRLVVTSRDGLGAWGGRVTGLRVEGTAGKVSISVSQLAGLTDGVLKSSQFTIAAPDALTHDLTGDARGDFAQLPGDGTVRVSAWAGSSFKAPVTRASGVTDVRQALTGQFTSDRYADLLTVDGQGHLRLHANRGPSFGEGETIASGMGGYEHFTLVPNFVDGRTALVARRTSDGALVRWQADGRGGLRWNTPAVITPSGFPRATALVGVRDLTGDGRSDLVVRTTSGELWAWAGDGTGALAGSKRIGTGWGSFTSIATPGDLNGDRRSDLVVRLASGETRLYRTTSTGFTRVDLAPGQGRIAS